jgi:hypothetical protein
VHTVDPATASVEASATFGAPVEIAQPGAVFQIGANE